MQLSTQQTNARKLNRTATGTTLLELPMAMWIVFVVLLIPMLGLASITLRGAILDSVVRDAAHTASKAPTYLSTSSEGPSAVEAAKATVADRISAFPGITVSSVETQIVITEMSTGNISKSSVPLVLVDSSKFIYQVETTVNGQVDPLVPGDPLIFGNIPGLTAPLTSRNTAREMFENAQGLTQ